MNSSLVVSQDAQSNLMSTSEEFIERLLEGLVPLQLPHSQRFPLFVSLDVRGPRMVYLLVDGSGHDGVGDVGVGALDEPGRSAAGEARRPSGGVTELVTPDRQPGLECQRRRLEVVAVVTRRSAQLVPLRVDGGRRDG